MKNQWFRLLFGMVLGFFLLGSYLSADQVERNHYTNQNLNLPLNQIGQDGQQQTKNNNQKLFQTDQVGDIGKQRQKLEKQGKSEVFQNAHKIVNPYTPKNVFVKHVKTHKVTYDYTQQTKTKRHFHFSYWMVIVIGILVGLLATWKMLRSEKCEQRSANHRRVAE